MVCDANNFIHQIGLSWREPARVRVGVVVEYLMMEILASLACYWLGYLAS